MCCGSAPASQSHKRRFRSCLTWSLLTNPQIPAATSQANRITRQVKNCKNKAREGPWTYLATGRSNNQVGRGVGWHRYSQGSEQSVTCLQTIFSLIHTLSSNKFSCNSSDATPRPDFPLGWLRGVSRALPTQGLSGMRMPCAPQDMLPLFAHLQDHPDKLLALPQMLRRGELPVQG